MGTSDFYILDNSDIEDKKLEAAKGLYQAGNYSGALKLYLDMVNMSYSYKLYYEIGRCYYKLNDFDNAETHFLRSIALDEVRNPSYVFLGNIYYKKQYIEKAIEYWVTSFSYKPDDESVCLNLATSYFSRDMKFQALFYYEKYLKYAKDKETPYYLEIKKSVDEFLKLGGEFYQKALRAVANKDNETAIQALLYAVKYLPTNFDINFLLGKLYNEEKMYLQSLIYLKQAYCLDNKSLDVLQKLATVMIDLGDFTGAYCCFKRMLPLVINNQKEYLDIIKSIKHLEESFDKYSFEGHKTWAEKYYSENNYHLALYEYENCLIMNTTPSEYGKKVEKLKSFLYSEDRIIKSCFDRASALYINGEYKQANKFYSRIMTLAKEDSSEYRYAKSRMTNV